MHALAALLLVGMGSWGALLYPDMPDQVPTHWDFGGEADAFSPKSIVTTFGPLLVAAGLFIAVLAVHLLLHRERHFVPAERRAYDLTFGYLNLSLVAIMSWLAYSAWFDLNLGPLFIAFTLFAGLPVLIIIGLHLPAISRERKASESPEEPSLNPKYWVLNGFLYSNPEDPRTFVPKPPHTGFGTTVNIASFGGRLFLAGLLLLILGTLALPLIL